LFLPALRTITKIDPAHFSPRPLLIEFLLYNYTQEFKFTDLKRQLTICSSAAQNFGGYDRDIKENRTKQFRRHPGWHIIDDDVGFEMRSKGIVVPVIPLPSSRLESSIPLRIDMVFQHTSVT